MTKYKIRKLSPEDWCEYKTIRLESLRDAPDSFGSTLNREASFTPEQWQARLRVSKNIFDSVAYSAIVDHSSIGLVSCVVHASGDESAHLYQMWVSPGFRNGGVGTALLEHAKLWANDRGVRSLLLSVTKSNSEAISLYRAAGFMPVGKTEPLRDGSVLQSQFMRLNLAASEA